MEQALPSPPLSYDRSRSCPSPGICTSWGWGSGRGWVRLHWTRVADATSEYHLSENATHVLITRFYCVFFISNFLLISSGKLCHSLCRAPILINLVFSRSCVIWSKTLPSPPLSYDRSRPCPSWGKGTSWGSEDGCDGSQTRPVSTISPKMPRTCWLHGSTMYFLHRLSYSPLVSNVILSVVRRF